MADQQIDMNGLISLSKLPDEDWEKCKKRYKELARLMIDVFKDM